MATNLEFKARCESLEALLPRLADLQATHRETVHQVDTYFHTQTGRVKLREIAETGEGWLIYYERPNQPASRYSQYQLCEIAAPSVLKELLAAAFGVKTTVEKRREVWIFNNTRIHLDTVAGLGQFVELETVFQGQTDAEAVEEHQRVKITLNLDTAEPIAGSYSELV